MRRRALAWTLRRMAAQALDRLAAPARRLALRREPELAELLALVGPYTMSSPARLAGLYRAVRRTVAAGVPGDVVECGTARGGSAALLGLALERSGASARRLWVFDTFAGLPPPTADDPDFEVARGYTGACRGERAAVEALFERLGILDRAVLVEGLFQDTVAGAGPRTISVLHLDGDWYDSVRVCLEHLYPRVAPGGVVQIDDYGHWAGARRATDEYLAALPAPRPRLEVLDYTGRQMVKPGAPED